MKNAILLVVFLIVTSCTMKSQHHKEYQELHKHSGTENYEVIEIYDTKFKIEKDVLFDTNNKNVIVQGFKEQKLENKNLYNIKEVGVWNQNFQNLKL